MIMCLHAMTFGYMTHICCDVIVAHELLLTAHESTVFVRTSTVLKQNTIYLTSLKNIFLRNISFILFFTDVQRNRLGRFVRVYITVLALEINICYVRI